MPVLPFWDQGLDIPMAGAPYGIAAWDLCVLGGYVLSGRARVDVDRGQKLDVKPSPGTNGATITYQGYEPANVKITLTMWHPDQLTAIMSVLPALEPAPGASTPTPYDILHPAAAMRNVSSVIIKKITGPIPGSEKSTMQLVFDCIQYFPVNRNQSATSTPTNSIPPFGNALAPSTAPTPPSTTVAHP